MVYGQDVVELTIKNVVDLFPVNDKSVVTIIKSESEQILFSGRVDYLQYSAEGGMHSLCDSKILELDVGTDCLIIYV